VGVARRDGKHFESATWLHKAREMPKEKFQQAAEKELTGNETEPEPSELMYFKDDEPRNALPRIPQPFWSDSEENLVTLCSTCHASVHGRSPDCCFEPG
jgi:hypothetical protein